MTKSKIDCFTCGKELRNFDTKYNQPLGGLEFTSYGHYGTTFFDPMDGTSIAINICDECLKERTNRILKIKRVNSRKMKIEKKWSD